MTAPRRPSFKQIDVTRAIRGARAAGVEVDRVEVLSDGRMIVQIARNRPDSQGFANEWDEVLQ